MNVCCVPPIAADESVARIVDALRDPACFPHPVRRIAAIETHISWVVLTGDYAYKIKKPVNLGFLDFTSLASRRHFCQEELRLNRRLAPDLYLRVVTIAGDPTAPRVGGAGPALDYAVKMREFEQSALLDATLARGDVDAATIEALAQRIAEFHAAGTCAVVAPGVDAAASVLAPAIDNFEQILPLLDAPTDIAALNVLRDWVLHEHHRAASLHGQRLAAGRVRECHGDLHLGNIVLLGGVATPFDGVEFNPTLRWIDVMSEVAFLMMDLEAHGRRDLAFVFLNAYLEHSGDYRGVATLPFYLMYRALVRAKVSLLRASECTDLPIHQTLLDVYRRYVALATSYTHARRGAVIVTHGLSGSGKTMATQQLLATLGAVRVRSDVERKRLYGLPTLARTGSANGTGIYSADATLRVYEQLAQYASSIADAGFPVIADATFLKHGQRTAFRALGQELGVPFAIINFRAPHNVLRARVAARAARSDDASEAELGVLDTQMATREPLTADELLSAFPVDADGDAPAGVDRLTGALRARIQC